MLPIIFPKKDKPLKILCLGAHCDDIEIGCGGTMLRLLGEEPETFIQWVVFSSNEVRAAEFQKSSHCFLGDVNAKKCRTYDFQDGYFPHYWKEIKDRFEQLKLEIAPDIIFTHFRDDLHQDHRIISDLTWNTFRNHLIFEYEIPKYDGDIGKPNIFVHLDKSTCTLKISHILSSFTSQAHHRWFTEDTFYALLRLRGIECNAPENCAEGFYCRKAVI